MLIFDKQMYFKDMFDLYKGKKITYDVSQHD